MTKLIKKILITVFSALLLVCAFLALNPVQSVARADGTDTYFSFVPGAYTHYGTMYDEEGESRWIMGFGVKKQNLSTYVDIRNEPKSFWLWNENPRYDYGVTLYRKNGSESVKLLTLAVGYELDGDSVLVTYALQKYVYYTEAIYFADQDFSETEIASDFGELTTTTGETVFVKSKRINTANYSGKLNLPFGPDGGIMIAIEPNEPYSEYFVEFSYEYLTYTNGGITGKKQTTTGSCRSSERSLYSTFNNMESAGMLEEEIKPAFGDEAYTVAYDIIHKKEQRTVAIQYLQQIPGTPFAEKVTQSAEVTMQQGSNELPADAAAAALGLSSFDCLQSYCDGLIPSENGNTFVAHYFNAVWLKARTVDGNDYNYYLNINESYADFYQHFVDAGIFDQGAYETVYSTQIYSKYAELEGFGPEEIYGYFGFAMIPKTYGINTLWTEFFDTKTSQSGIISTFEYGADVTLSEYNSLLQDYNYSFLARIWNDTANLFLSGSEDTTCYILYAEPGTESAFIAENGGDDINDDTGAAGQLGGELGGLIGSVVVTVEDGFGAIGDFFAGLSSRAKAVSAIIIFGLVILAVILIARIFKKSKN